VCSSDLFSPGQTVQNFNNNRLCYNTKYNVENGSDLNLGLEKNCFCLQDSAAIEALIYDGYDVYKLVGLEFQAKDVNDYQIDENTNGNEWDVIYTIGTASDLWGDIPNREAVNGLEGTVNPAYDKQEEVIKDIQLYLSEAITLLSKAEAENAILPGNDDLIFTGKIDAWKATASVLKARYYNRLSKRDAGGSADNALTALADTYAAGFTSNAANCNANFGTNSNE
jgi:hypothetical protein